MKLYIKGFYGYRNFGDEMLFFGLLNYLQREYNPESFTVEVGDLQRIQTRIQHNKTWLEPGILDKLDFVENAVISRRFRQLQIFLGLDKYRKYFKVFGGGEVLDESRKFPHDGWNLKILYRHDIRKKNFILVGGIGTDQKKYTKKLFKYMFKKTKRVICREKTSYERAVQYGAKSAVLYQDFSKDILEDFKNKNPVSLFSTVLINISPKHFTDDNIEKIKKFVLKYPDHKKIFFPADINFDKEFYSGLRKVVPDLVVYDWTKHSLLDTLKLFQSCDAGIGSRLHFLYPLKVFEKEFVSLSSSDKVSKFIK
ncbi:MAG TPA: polysaccharide pyruvyl transferase family protein [Candidatus Absconditabacterales bacterium]|nr:polysaccharide pyruvyl transferase family protein [Candidatus Absconditabacterales bacterium]